VRFQGNALPVARDVAKQSMFDLVLLAGARRKMAHFQNRACPIGKPLKFRLPKTIAMTVAAAAVAGNQQPSGVAVSLLPHSLPPFLSILVLCTPNHR
jgi:hypothetical protein